MIRELSDAGVEIAPFPEAGPLPTHVDAVWDPGLCMRSLAPILREVRGPLLGTMHGVKTFSLPLEELARSPEERATLEALHNEVYTDWMWLRERISAVLAVSQYAAEEVIRAFEVPQSLVHVVPNGVDTTIFTPIGTRALVTTLRPYFLHVSNGHPIKNLPRLVAAYEQLPEGARPDLVLVVSEPIETISVSGVTVIRKVLDHKELARWYRGALAFVLPSLRETFGLTLIEAMACGCPVVTSWDTGCSEVGGDAVVRVNPRSVGDLTLSLERVWQDAGLRIELSTLGPTRAGEYSWRNSAAALLAVLSSLGIHPHE
jgi:glycosyltransferase involved in cell wall biosynthesis